MPNIFFLHATSKKYNEKFLGKSNYYYFLFNFQIFLTNKMLKIAKILRFKITKNIKIKITNSTFIIVQNLKFSKDCNVL